MSAYVKSPAWLLRLDYEIRNSLSTVAASETFSLDSAQLSSEMSTSPWFQTPNPSQFNLGPQAELRPWHTETESRFLRLALN